MCYHVAMLQDLNLRHQEIIRLAFTGLSVTAIAEQVGFSIGAVRGILKSELAQAEIARLKERAEDSLTNVPMRARLINELSAAGADAVRINHDLMRNEQIDPRVRAGIGRHFMDRVVFDKQEGSQEGGYREILRSLDRLERKVDSTPVEGKVVDGA